MSEENKDLELSEQAEGDKAAEQKKRKPLEIAIYEWGRCLITGVVTVVLLFTFFLRIVSVRGISMQDTLYTGDRLLIVNAMFCDFKPGDIVVVDAYNAVLNDTIVKRVIAVEGQTVDINFATGTVYVDGIALDEPYAKAPTYTTDGTHFPLTLGESELFLMGDNRNHSTDSRSDRLGVVREDYLQGKAICLLLPGKSADSDKMDLSRIGLIN